MTTHRIRFNTLLATLALLLTATQLHAQDDSIPFAENLMRHQLDALQRGDLQAFLVNGNDTFKRLTDEYTFDSLKMQHQDRLANGYSQVHLGKLKRLGMWEHLWKVRITDYKYDLLGKLSVSHGKVVGFDLY